MSNPTVTVQYKTQQHYCHCCHQKLPEVKTSKLMEFKISKEGALNWVDWNVVSVYPEDMESLVPEYIRETISFHTAESDEQILVEDSEIEIVKKFILSEVIDQNIATTE